MKNRRRVLYYDLLNIAACIAVITLHHNGLVHIFTGDTVWKECLIAEVGFYWAVPAFLMLSGATLLNYRSKYTTKVFFKKRFMRVVFPWIFWSVTILVWKTLSGEYIWENYGLREFVNIILNSKMEVIYWFFPVIIGLYMFIPVLSLLAENRYRKILWYIVGYSLLVDATLPLLCSLTSIQWNGAISSPLNGYIIFVILGYLLSTEDISKKNRRLIYLSGIAGAVVRYIGTYVLSMRDGSVNGIFSSYVQIHSFALAAAVFVFFKYIEWDKILGKSAQKWIADISGCSLGIYLIHRRLMDYELKIVPFPESSLLWRTGGIIMTYGISLIIVYSVKKIPILKKVFP